MLDVFNYDEAFSRNLGWVTPDEVQLLKKAKVAIGGAGGVGGLHMITLSRLGISQFHIADPDTFELKNFNRQYGADITTIGKNKCEVMKMHIKNINPLAEVRVFQSGITKENLSDFLSGVDIYVDGLDVFEVDVRQMVFEECRRRKIPCITVAPIGMGAALLNFTSSSMSFEDYFGFRGKSETEKVMRFTLGLSPSMVYLKSLVSREYSNLNQKRTASTTMGCQMASGILGTEVLKMLLKRGPCFQAPVSIHYDAYTYNLKKRTMWWGCRNPFFRIKLIIMKRILDQIPNKQIQGAS